MGKLDESERILDCLGLDCHELAPDVPPAKANFPFPSSACEAAPSCSLARNQSPHRPARALGAPAGKGGIGPVPVRFSGVSTCHLERICQVQAQKDSQADLWTRAGLCSWWENLKEDWGLGQQPGL